jgi:hypothetical protein
MEKVIRPRKQSYLWEEKSIILQRYMKGYLVFKEFINHKSTRIIQETQEYFQAMQRKIDRDAILLIIYHMKRYSKKVIAEREAKKKA